MILSALCLCYAGFVGLYLAVPRHYKTALRREPARWQPIALRVAGWAAIAAAFAVSVRAGGWEMGPVLWFCLLSVSALFLVFLLPYAQRRLLALPLLCLPLAAVAALLSV